MVLNLALNYGGRAEIVRATKKIVRDFSDGLITPEKIDENPIFKLPIHKWSE